jgi:hypothetical protein
LLLLPFLALKYVFLGFELSTYNYTSLKLWSSIITDNCKKEKVVEDLDATVKKLRERGAQFVTEPKDQPNWGIRTAHLRDPDGNLIEINSPMPTTEWSEELREEASKFKEKQ